MHNSSHKIIQNACLYVPPSVCLFFCILSTDDASLFDQASAMRCHTSVFNHSTLEFCDFSNKIPRQLSIYSIDVFLNADSESPPHAVGLKCLPDRLSAKNILDHVTSRDMTI